MKDKSKLVAIILAILAIIAIIVSLVSKEEVKKEKYKTEIVTNYSNFYTVDSCISRTINYISNKDNENLYLVINDDYKTKNNITKENVLDIFGEIKTNTSFVSRKMYSKKIDDNVTKYFVSGYIQENQLFDNSVVKNQSKQYMYFVVYLDSSSKLFSVEPYSGKIFEGDENEE